MMATSSDENSTLDIHPWYPRPSTLRVVHIYDEKPWYSHYQNKRKKKWK